MVPNHKTQAQHTAEAGNATKLDVQPISTPSGGIPVPHLA